MNKIVLLLILPWFVCANKWIVITSINYPTEAVKKAVAMDGWQVVVVGDTKSPKDWHLDGCHYLSLEDQGALPYHIAQLLPTRSYCRKNIGYLYAIEHGATEIYETDDDNDLYVEVIQPLPKNCPMNSYTAGQQVVNPYAYFGQPTVWPRGYPLSMVIQHPGSVDLMKHKVRPYIQQGVADGDPDVDAIFRLTRQFDEIVFEKRDPIALSSGTFCPFNSQTTFFHQEAFWALFIPTTTAFRVCDIWRGYWAQRLLWDIGGNLCFTPPIVYQDRNDHNILDDFNDEIDLYTKTEDLIELLGNWHSNKPTLPERIIELSELMIQHGFFEKKEIMIIKAWINDLNVLGYVWPEVIY